MVLSAKGAEVILPDDITLEEAIRMNEESGRLDGIERIENGGTVVFADYTNEIMMVYIGELGYGTRYEPVEAPMLTVQ